MRTKDRLKIFVKSLNMGQNTFEKEVGIANGYIASKSQTISSDTVERVIEKYPELNLEWLFRGEGKMLKSSSTIGDLPLLDLEKENIALRAENKLLRELNGLGERKESKNAS